MIGLAILGALLGLVLGSYVTTAALRATRGEPSVTGRSHCDGCQVRLSFAQTTPVISYVVARGACRTCGARIDPVHPIGEVAGGVGGALLMLAVQPLTGLLMAAAGLALLATSVVDARTRKLPDSLTLLVAAAGAILAWRQGPVQLGAGVIAAALATLILLGLRRAFSRLKRDPGLGLGDVKLIAALALWLGVWTPWMVVLAAGLGLVSLPIAQPRDGKIAFGPMIALSAWILGLAMEASWWPVSA